MITFFQHVYPINDYRTRAALQRVRIRNALFGLQPYRVVSCECESERVTLRQLWQEARSGPMDDLYVYLHLKGITKPGTQDDWAEMLEYFTIDCWEKADYELRSGADVMGCDHALKPAPHFSGNFFWMRGEVAHWLANPCLTENPEAWLFTSIRPLIIREFHKSTVNHYTDPYPPECYR